MSEATLKASPVRISTVIRTETRFHGLIRRRAFSEPVTFDQLKHLVEHGMAQNVPGDLQIRVRRHRIGRRIKEISFDKRVVLTEEHPGPAGRS